MGENACLIRLFASGIVCMAVRFTIFVVTCAYVHPRVRAYARMRVRARASVDMSRINIDVDMLQEKDLCQELCVG
jgi:hypothetical protein